MRQVIRRKTQILDKTIAVIFAICSLAALPDIAHAKAGFVYWTNSPNGSVGRATTKGTKANEKFITLNTTGGAGLSVDDNYIY